MSPIRLAPLLVLALVSPALAHTGAQPHVHGLAAGLWHPVSGLDHLLAMAAVGVLGRPRRRRPRAGPGRCPSWAPWRSRRRRPRQAMRRPGRRRASPSRSRCWASRSPGGPGAGRGRRCALRGPGGGSRPGAWRRNAYGCGRTCLRFRLHRLHGPAARGGDRPRGVDGPGGSPGGRTDRVATWLPTAGTLGVPGADDGDRVLQLELGDRQVLREVLTIGGGRSAERLLLADHQGQVLECLRQARLGLLQGILSGQWHLTVGRNRPTAIVWAAAPR